MNDVVEFINRRFKDNCHWLDGNCYWFSKILSDRFGLDIYLFEIENHFMAGDGKIFYDWSTVRYIDDCLESPIKFSDLKDIDPLLYNKLIRDCVN